MSRSTAKGKAWYKQKRDDGCLICGTIFLGRENKGMIMSHIIDKKSGIKGELDSEDNCLALCANCEKSFDEKIKPAIYRAMYKFNKGKIPEKWKKSNTRDNY